MFACVHSRSVSSASEPLVELAFTFSPLVELTRADTVVFDVAGQDLLFGKVSEVRDHPGLLSRLATTIAQRARQVKMPANICIAANPDTAIHGARLLSQMTIIDAGDELRHLGSFSIKQLDCSLAAVEQRKAEEIYQTFALWGVRTFRDLAQLPLAGVAERLGQEGVRLQQLAQGKTDRALNLVRPPIGFVQSLELEHPVSELEPLSFILSRLLNQLCANLNEHALATNELRWELVTDKNSGQWAVGSGQEDSGQWAVGSGQQEDTGPRYGDAEKFIKATDHRPLSTGHFPPATAHCPLPTAHFPPPTAHCPRTLTLPVPMRNPKTLLRLLLFEIEREPPPAPIAAITITAEPVQPRAAQTGLFVPLAPEPERLEITLARLAKLVGAENVGSPELLDTHRPDAFRMKRFTVSVGKKRSRSNPQSVMSNPQLIMGFRIFRPPWLAQVHTSKGQPTHIDARAKSARKLSGKIIRAAGPWRGSGDWWRPDVWARDEWDVAVSDSNQSSAVLCRIYRDLTSEQWFIAGIYD